jgi:hypothetical protein
MLRGVAAWLCWLLVLLAQLLLGPPDLPGIPLLQVARQTAYLPAQESAERDNERVARHIVSTVLGVPVKRFDYGTAPRQVDALIHSPASKAALEIVADHDPESKAQWDALRRVKYQIRMRAFCRRGIFS